MRAYGKLKIERGQILVSLDPVAAIRFKRIFARVDKTVKDWLGLSATPENGREIAWFCERFPLEVSGDDAARLHDLAEAYDRQIELVERIMSPDYEPPAVDLALPPRPYQVVPANLLRATGGVLVGDEVGLGKTVASIVAMCDEGALPAVVVTLTHLPRQFAKEINRFAPALRVHVIRVGAPVRPSDLQRRPLDLAAKVEYGEPLPDVVVLSYSKLAGWAQWLAEYVKPSLVVFDEVQEFRHGFKFAPGKPNVRNRAGLYLAQHAQRRLGLSATPIHNNGAEIFNVLECLAPGALGEEHEFKREWCAGGTIVHKPQALGQALRDRGLFIRRTKAEVGRELPELTISEQYCDADPKVIEDMQQSSRALELAKFVLSGKREAFQASGELDMLLRQKTGLAKAPFVAAFVDMLLQSEEPVVLYGWHHGVYDVWRDVLKEHRPVFYTGKQTEQEKDAAVKAFCSGETRLFVISLRSVAGLDGLQYAGCSNVVFGELDWSPAVHEQAIGRVRRDGIAVPVTAWFMVSAVGADPVMAEKLGVKRGQLEGLRNPKADVVAGQTDPDAIKRLAADFLKRRGEVAEPSAPVSAPVFANAGNAALGLFGEDVA